jgi:acyl carrier protein
MGTRSARVTPCTYALPICSAERASRAGGRQDEGNICFRGAVTTASSRPRPAARWSHNEAAISHAHHRHERGHIHSPVPAVSYSRAASERTPMGHTDLEERIATIWRRVLGVSDIHTSDDFFDEGGSSFEAIELVAGIQDELNIALSFRSLFERSTFAEVVASAAAASRKTSIESSPQTRYIPTSSADEIVLPLLPNQGGLLSWQQWTEAHGLPVDPMNLGRIYRIRGRLDVPALEQALSALVTRHDALRASFPANGQAGIQVIGVPARQGLRVVEVSQEAIDEYVTREIGQRPDLGATTQLRTTLLQIDSTDFVLIIVVSHLVADGWSVVTITRELEMLYKAFVRKQPPPLQPLPTNYVDHVREEFRWLASEDASEATRYWEQTLGRDNAFPRLALTFQRRPPSNETGVSFAYHEAAIPRTTIERLTHLGPSRSMSAGFLAGIMSSLLLNAATPLRGVMTTFSNRGVPERQSLVGWLTNPAILRFDISADESFLAVLHAAQNSIVDALDSGRLPFMEMVRRLDPAAFVQPPKNDFVIVIYDDAFLSGPALDLQLENLTVNRMAPRVPTGHEMAMSIRLYPRPDGDVGMGFIYDTQQFASNHIAAFAGTICEGFTRAVDEPKAPISRAFRALETL